jgi:uncharacterized coiled-coil protein SlyX
MNEKSRTDDSTDEVVQLRERIVSLEMLAMHLQQENETLGKVLLDQQKQVDQLRSQLDKLGVRVEEALMEPEVRDPQLEKPPHY